jgi:hypothetical protein
MTAPNLSQPRAASRPNLPKGLRWSNVWKLADGTFHEAAPGAELPVDEQWQITGSLWVCPMPGCGLEKWTFDDTTIDDAPCCSKHPTRLARTSLDGAEPDPVQGARSRAAVYFTGIYQRRRDAVVSAANERAAAARKAVEEATRRTAADMRGHLPSIAASAVVLGAGTPLIVADPVLAALAGVGSGPVALVAYLVAMLVRRLRRTAQHDEKQARRDRRIARHVGAGVLATGMWLAGSAALAWLPMFFHVAFTLLFGLLLTFAVNHAHWQDLWATRHRLKDLARRRAEAERRRLEEEARLAAERVAAQPGTVDPAVDESNPLVVGQRFADEWQRVAATQQPGGVFPQMARTWINPTETRELTVPDVDGNQVRIGWEYSGHAQPGALVARQGMPSPVVAAREWLSATLFDGAHEASKLSIVDRVGGNPNRFVVMVTERLRLGEAVAYKGRAGIRRGSDGSLYGHVGQTLLGDDAERVLWVPGQAGGGGRYGVTGSGKSVVTQISLLNDLYAGIFTALWDGKNFMDFAEFIGVIPMGCTNEHRDVMLRSFRAEMERRQQMLTLLEAVDRHGRPAPVEALWTPDRDGPPQRWTIEEFHLHAGDDEFIGTLTELIRLQRSSATMLELATQGGGLADTGNSVLRDNLNQIAMQVMRMGDQQARLTGYKGDYMPSELPRLPGMMLMVEADAPAVPVRGAYVHRRDEDGNIYDHLFDKNNNPILTAPTLPAETIEVYEREGLMDLWRAGQGPGGKRRLLSYQPDVASAVPTQGLGPFAGQAMQAEDVILAIAYREPGLGPTAISQHKGWQRPVSPTRTPALSTITRAAGALDEKQGLLTRDGGYRVTEKGRERAAALARTLFGDPDAAVREAENTEEVPS